VFTLIAPNGEKGIRLNEREEALACGKKKKEGGCGLLKRPSLPSSRAERAPDHSLRPRGTKEMGGKMLSR